MRKTVTYAWLESINACSDANSLFVFIGIMKYQIWL
jgi:hypothetical protein